jgi:hypothetical protein
MQNTAAVSTRRKDKTMTFSKHVTKHGKEHDNNVKMSRVPLFSLTCKRGLVEWLKWYNVCLASVRP